jgi:transcriptional regulator with XRE-family HTH domain
VKSPGERIQALREESGLSRADLAKKLKASRLWVWRIESGETRLLVEDLPRFARALGVDVKALLA